MFKHFSLRGIRAAMAAVVALASAKGVDPKTLPPIEAPAELMGKRRKGMSAKSGYARWRGNRNRMVRLGRATGPNSYAEASPQDLIRQRRAIRGSLDRRGKSYAEASLQDLIRQRRAIRDAGVAI